MMNKRLLFMQLTLAAGLVFEDGQAWAWQKDPDSLVDPAKVVTSTLLPAPDVMLGVEDTTVAGIADAVVGANDMTPDPLDPAPSGTTFWVDNTPLNGDCPQATFTTIQAAVNASGPNDTIKVCPGTYTEQVQITGHTHDRLRLESLTPLAATIKWPSVPSSNHQLVHVNGTDRVIIRGRGSDLGWRDGGVRQRGRCRVGRGVRSRVRADSWPVQAA